MNISDIFSGNSRVFYIWGAFGAFMLALVIEVALLKMRLNKVKKGHREK